MVPSPKKSRKESNVSVSDDEGIKNYQKWDNFDPKKKKKKQPLNKKNKNKKTTPVQELISEAKIEDSTIELI